MRPDAYAKFIKSPKSGLRQVMDAGPVLFEVQYKPLEYVCLLQNNSVDISSKQLKQLEKEFSGLLYFNFSIVGKDAGDPLQGNELDSVEFNQRVKYLSFNATKDFWLLSGNDTFKCVMCHFERNYGLGSRDDLVLAFEPQSTKPTRDDKSVTFCFRDKIFNTGIQTFIFSENTLHSIPKVKTN
jgi:hypothetical protein